MRLLRRRQSSAVLFTQTARQREAGSLRGPALGAIPALLSVATLLSAAPSQVDTANLQIFLRTQLQLSGSELAALNQGRPVVKTLPATTKREMTTAGGVRIRGAGIERFVSQFKTLEGFRTSQFVLQIGKFGQDPQLSDLDALTLEADDIDALRKCRVAGM